MNVARLIGGCRCLACGWLGYASAGIVRERQRCPDCGRASLDRDPVVTAAEAQTLLVRRTQLVVEAELAEGRRARDEEAAPWIDCPRCGQLWRDPVESHSFPGSACDIEECICTICEAGDVDEQHRADHVAASAEWRRYWSRTGLSR